MSYVMRLTQCVCLVDAAGPSTSAAASQEPEEPKFLAFAGSGRRLDGKTPKHEAQPVAVPLNQYRGQRLPG